MNKESIIAKIREYASQDKIPYSCIAVDAIGVGAGVASSSLLDGIIGFKSSYSAVKTEVDIVRLPNVHYIKEVPLVSEYKNLRSQCIFNLAELVNNHKIASRVTGRQKEVIIEELSNYQDVSQGDGKRMATAKEDIKAMIGRSSDASDCSIMRCYFVIRAKISPNQSQDKIELNNKLQQQFLRNENRQILNNAK